MVAQAPSASLPPALHLCLGAANSLAFELLLRGVGVTLLTTWLRDRLYEAGAEDLTWHLPTAMLHMLPGATWGSAVGMMAAGGGGTAAAAPTSLLGSLVADVVAGFGGLSPGMDEVKVASAGVEAAAAGFGAVASAGMEAATAGFGAVAAAGVEAGSSLEDSARWAAVGLLLVGQLALVATRLVRSNRRPERLRREHARRTAAQAADGPPTDAARR